MFKRQIFKNLKTKLIMILSLIFMLSLCLFSLSACGEGDSTDVKDPAYTIEETKKDSLIKNPTFDLETFSLKPTDYPKITVSGWTRSVDNSAKNSTVSSGIVSTLDENWKGLVKNLYNDTDFKAYVKSKDVSIIDDSKSDDENVNAIIEKLLKNPRTFEYDSAEPNKALEDTYVYMLNNFGSKSEFGLGTAQKIASVSSLSIKAGEIAKISIRIKTQNLSSINNKYGANVRLVNTFAGKTQSEVRIDNIIANEWTEYTIFVKADEVYGANLTLNVGLGYGNGKTTDARDFVEGTVYFDDAKYEIVDSIPTSFVESSTNTYTMQYGSKEINSFDNQQQVLYKMEFDSNANFTKLNLNENACYFTKGNITQGGVAITSQTILGTEDSKVSTPDGITNSTDKLGFELKNASYTVKLDNNGNNFKLKNGEYTIIKFTLSNKLTGFGSTSVFVDIMDKYGDVEKLRKTVMSYDKNDGATEYTITVKNEFNEGNDREFYINLVIGPNDISAVKYPLNDFANGTVILENYMYSGILEINDENKEKFDFYSNSLQFSLYAGYGSSQEDDETEKDYNLDVAYSSKGTIINAPANPKDYIGVDTNSYAVKSTGTVNYNVNTRSGSGDTLGNIAGLINTKYLDNYSITALKDKLNYPTDEEETQILMIYNATKENYGFIGESNLISSNSLSLITVTLKVTDNAQAFIYLVDTKSENKDVLTFNSFTTDNGVEIDGSNLKFQQKVTDTNGEWVTINFYIGTGKSDKDLRLEIWNGARDDNDETPSNGFVFVKDITIKTSGGFTEPSRLEDTFSISGNPLYDQKITSFEKEGATLYTHTRKLDDVEKAFNEEYPDKAVKYTSKYVWATTDNFIYGIFNTIDPKEVDPYESITEDDDSSNESGCTASSDPSTFWLSFSSVLLGVVLVLAIIALFVKNIRRRRKANASDAKIHYQVKSRVGHQKKEKETVKETISNETDDIETIEDVNIEDASAEETPTEESTLDEYVYGDVQDFGNDQENK